MYDVSTCTFEHIVVETMTHEIRLSRKFAFLSSILFNHKSLKQISFSANTINIYEFELRFIADQSGTERCGILKLSTWPFERDEWQMTIEYMLCENGLSSLSNR